MNKQEILKRLEGLIEDGRKLLNKKEKKSVNRAAKDLKEFISAKA